MRRSLRRDPLSGRWVALCDGHVRIARPDVPLLGAACPWCTPPARVLDRRGEAWARPHPVPVTIVEAAGAHEGLGAHEVVVARSAHGGLLDAPGRALVDLLDLAQARHADLAGDRRLHWHGLSVALGDAHGHGEVVALPFVPTGVQAMGEAVRSEPRLLERLGDQAWRDGRGLLDVGVVRAWVPEAPSVPFEVRVVPRVGAPRWHHVATPELEAVGHLAHAVGRALRTALGTERMTIDLLQAPQGWDPGPLWHLRIRPATEVSTVWMGGEVAAHPGLPGPAAERLRPLCHDAWRQEDGSRP